MSNEFIQLDLLSLKDQLVTKKIDGKPFLFDAIRKKWLRLQPEEMVRQLFIHYLIRQKNYNPNRFSLEKGLKVMSQDKRFDLLVYDLDMNPFLLLECKAPKVKITQATFAQIHAYNYDLNVPYQVISNGIYTYCYQIDWEKEAINFLNDIPEYP